MSFITKNINKIIAVVSSVILASVVISSSFCIIPTGYTGVRTTFGQIDQKPVSAGFNWKIPFVQKINYGLRICKKGVIENEQKNLPQLRL